MKTLSYLVKTMFTLFLLLFFSCDRGEINGDIQESIGEILSKDQIEDASMEEKINYKKHHLEVLGSWFANNYINTANMFHESETEKNSTDEIFFEELIESSSLEKKDDNISVALNAFTGLYGVNWKPSIFLLGNARIKTQKTFLAIESNTHNGEFFQGYEISSNRLIPLRNTITPEIVGDNNLYVIELDRQFEKNTRNLSNKLNHELVIEKMKIKDRKEAWPGRSEIAFQGFKVYNPYSSETFECGEYITGSANCMNYSGKRITKLKRKYKNKTRTYNFAVKSNNSGDDLIYYTIFEEDSFPVIKKVVQFNINNNGGKVWFLFASLNQAYDKQLLTQQQANSFNKSNSTIEYNLKLK